MCLLGDCLTARRERHWELWISIYEATCTYVHVHVLAHYWCSVALQLSKGVIGFHG